MDEATIYRYRWWALAVLSFSLLVIGIDNTILNVALPRLSESLNASNSQLQWIVDGYTIIYAGLILTTGSLGDRFGRKGALSIGLLVFGAGSVASAWASSASMLIATRCFMGIGGALIMPATLSILTNVFHDPKERARAIGVWAGVSAGGIAFGPLMGGILIAHFWWGSVFLVNVPVVLIALVGGHKVLPTSKDPAAPRLDPLGAVLSIAALMTLLWGLIEAPTKGWGSTPILSAFGIGIVLLAVFIAWELHTDHPMLEIRFFANARFSAANAGITLVFFALFGSSFLITQELQFVLGYSALKAGIAMMPIAVPMLILGPLSARIVERVGTKLVVTAGLLCASGGLFWLSSISLGGGYVDILLPMILLATGMGLTMAPATESIMGSIPRSKAGIGSAMNDTTRQVGGALGVAVIGSVLASVYRPHVTANLAHTTLGKVAAGSGPLAGQAQTAVNAIRDQLGAVYAVADKLPGGAGSPAGQELIHAARHAFVDGFGGAVLVGALVALVGAVVVFIFLPAHASDAPEDDPNVRFARAVDGELQTNQPLPDVTGTDGDVGLDDDPTPEPPIPAAAIGVVDTALVGAESADAEAVP
jgi:EmrB/QacA subfamily drug resistance transporter